MRHPLLLAVVQSALVAGILGCLVLVVARHPWRLDLTPEQRYTLSPHTHEVLERLQEPVDVTVFYSSQEGELRREMADLLARYTDVDPDVHVRMLDLDRNPGAAERLRVNNYNVAVIENRGGDGTRREHVDLVNEDALTAAFLRVAGIPSTVVYFVQGHGERDPRDADERRGAGDAAAALVADGFVVRTVDGAAHIPDDAGLVVLAGPTRDFGAGEVDALDAWVRRGGRLLVLTDPGTPTSLVDLLGRFGIEPGADIVVDEQARLFGTDGLSARIAQLNQAMVPSPPTAGALLPLAQSLRLVDRPGVDGDYLAVTGEGTWSDVDRRALAGENTVFRPGTDRHGPVPVAVLMTVPAGDGREGRIGVVGDADFVSNLHLNLVGNRDLLVTTAQLVARDDVLAAPRRPGPARGTFSGLALTQQQSRIVFWSAVIAPGVLLAATALVALRRRRAA
ncbi:MAG TPA: GldG family protein [Candidatus Binatia bacterium]|jgi:ABC-type uncharacterized transport system involved in gliding motility auxiliary subunit|nr:GldG family protein [Candidatus Binatia bacterium]